LERENFEHGITELFTFFRYSEPEWEVKFRWFEKVKYIPAPALGWIIDSLEDLHSLPRNIPKAIREGWYLYGKAHPEKIAHVEQRCEECHGTGILHFKKVESNYDPPMAVTYVAICAKCNNWPAKLGLKIVNGGIIEETGKYIPPTARLTRQKIVDLGWELLKPENRYAPKVGGRVPKPELKIVPQRKLKYDGPSLDRFERRENDMR